MVESRVTDSNMDCLSSNLFAVLVYYHEVGGVGSGVIVGNAMYVNCTGDMTIVFFHCLFQTSAPFSYVRRVAISFWVYLQTMFCFSCDRILSLGCYKDRFKGVGSFEHEFYADVSNDSSEFFTEVRNKDENIFLTSRPVSGFMMRVGWFFSGSFINQSGLLFLRRTQCRWSILRVEQTFFAL